MLPIKVMNRLRLGRPVAAKVPSTLEHHTAWVRVQPLIDPDRGRWDEPFGKERRAVSLDGCDPLRGFEIRHVELNNETVRDIWEVTELIPSIDERFQAADEEELEVILSRWLDDFSQLRIPSLAQYFRLD